MGEKLGHRAGRLGYRAGRLLSSPVFFPAGLLLAAALLLSAGSPVYPFGFEPITQDFAPAGPGTIQAFTLSNTGPETVAVRISMLTREMEPDGSEKREPADSLFLVYPSRAVLAPNSVQAIKVQWKGPSDVAVEQSYRILAEQVPVDFGGARKQGGSIKVMFRYMGAVYVVPKGAKQDVVLDSSAPGADSAGNKGLVLVFRNRGTAHALLGDLRLVVSAKNGSAKREFAGAELAGISGENVLAGHSRRFFLPLPDELQGGELDVAFRFEPLH